MQEDTTANAENEEVATDQAAETPDSEKTVEEINEEIEQELEKAAAEENLDPMAQLEADVLKWKNTAMRTAADLENYRKRMAREKTDAIKFGNQRLIEELLPVTDSFHMGMMAAEQDSDSMIYMGMKMVQTQLENFLESQGVKEVALKAGDAFDPNLHDAMSQEESDTFEDGKIIRIMRKGYTMGDRLIRPANVVVAQSAQPETEAPAEESAPTEDA